MGFCVSAKDASQTLTLKNRMIESSLFFSHTATSCALLSLFFVSMVIAFMGLFLNRKNLQTIGCYLALVGFCMQTVVLGLGFHKSFVGGLSAGAYLQLLAWFIALAALLLWFKLKQATAVTFAVPFCLALFAMSLPYMEETLVLPETVQSSFYLLHIASLFVSIALLSIATIVSILFLFLEGRIKGKRIVKGFFKDLPALMLLDRINGFCLLLSFPLYTVGIITGLLRAKPTYGASFTGDPKEIMSLIIWLLFALLFHNRLARAWMGRKPALLTCLIFFLSLFSLLIINTVMDSHHAFIRSN